MAQPTPKVHFLCVDNDTLLCSPKARRRASRLRSTTSISDVTCKDCIERLSKRSGETSVKVVEVSPADCVENFGINTKPIDYKGCVPVVAEALKVGVSVFCDYKVSKHHDWCSNAPKQVIGYRVGAKQPYITAFTELFDVRPMQNYRLIVVDSTAMMMYLLSNEYKLTDNGWLSAGLPALPKDLLQLCGKESDRVTTTVLLTKVKR